MKQAEFVSLLKRGAVEGVNIHTDDLLRGQWVVFAWVPEGSETVKEGIEPARSKELRTWSSLSTAHAWIRSLGWVDSVTVDGWAHVADPRSVLPAASAGVCRSQP